MYEEDDRGAIFIISNRMVLDFLFRIKRRSNKPVTRPLPGSAGHSIYRLEKKEKTHRIAGSCRAGKRRGVGWHIGSLARRVLSFNKAAETPNLDACHEGEHF